MKRYPLEGKEANPHSFSNFVLDNALGKVIVLDSAPSAASNTVPEKELGYYNNKLYMTIDGVLKEWSVTSTA